MFEKQKAEVIAGKIQKYAGNTVKAVPFCENGKWIVRVEILSDTFSMDFKGIEVRFKGRKNDGS